MKTRLLEPDELIQQNDWVITRNPSVGADLTKFDKTWGNTHTGWVKLDISSIRFYGMAAGASPYLVRREVTEEVEQPLTKEQIVRNIQFSGQGLFKDTIDESGTENIAPPVVPDPTVDDLKQMIGGNGPCDHYTEDPYICDDVGQPKGQCICGWKENDHAPKVELESEDRPASAYTCTKCGGRMVFNVPRMGPDGGFVHASTGSFECNAPTPQEVQYQMQVPKVTKELDALEQIARALHIVVGGHLETPLELQILAAIMIDKQELETRRNELFDLKNKCGICICPEEETDECCASCIAEIPNVFDEVARLQIELEQAKNDRNRAALLERQKYLPALADLRLALGAAKEALLNVPCVGEVYDQQHADTHMQAVVDIQKALDPVTQPDR